MAIGGGCHETGMWIDAVLLWHGDGASVVYSGNFVNFDLYCRLFGLRVSFILLLNGDNKAVYTKECALWRIPSYIRLSYLLMPFLLNRNAGKKYTRTSLYRHLLLP